MTYERPVKVRVNTVVKITIVKIFSLNDTGFNPINTVKVKKNKLAIK